MAQSTAYEAAGGTAGGSGYAVVAWPAAQLSVTSGANLGDPAAGADDPVPGDIYALGRSALPLRLILGRATQGQAVQIITAGSDIGQEGDTLTPEKVLTFLASDGDRVTVVTARHDASGAHFALPLAPLVTAAGYTLVDVHDYSAGMRLAAAICISFAAGTLITLPGGAQQPVEHFRPGDLVLTRDNGAQPVRWVGKVTLRARGNFAPVVISAGTFGNIGDLVVSPHHRIFRYQRGGDRLSGRAELLVQAKHLVDGDRIWRREGGFVDYYSLVLDRHEILFAEGIPAESLMVSEETLALLPGDLADDLRRRCPDLAQAGHFATEAARGTIERAGAKRLLRQ